MACCTQTVVTEFLQKHRIREFESSGPGNMGHCPGGISTAIDTLGFPVTVLLKKGIVLTLSGAGPSASSFLRARSVCE